MYLKHLKIVRPLNTYILNIAYESPDAQLAADVANAVAQSYLQHTFEIRVHSSSALSAFMERQLGELKAKTQVDGGFAPLIAAALTAAFGSVWPVIIYAAAIAVIGIIATAYSSFRPDVENAPRLADLGPVRDKAATAS